MSTLRWIVRSQRFLNMQSTLSHYSICMVSTRSRRGVPLPAPAPRRRRRNQDIIVRREKHYHPNDEARRHRLPDDDPKNVQVRPHARRNV